MVAAFDSLPVRQGRRRPLDRHRDARTRRRRARRPPAPRLRHRDRDRRPTARSSPQECFGDKVVWVPWRRPGFQLGLDIAAIKAANPQAIGCILGGHGITAWGDTVDEARGELALDHRDRGGLHRRARQARAVRRRRSTATSALPEDERRAKAAALAPTLRGLASHRPAAWSATSPTPTSCSTSSPRASTRAWPRSAPSCPDHFLRTKVKPDGARPAGHGIRRGIGRPPRRAARCLPRRLHRHRQRRARTR